MIITFIILIQCVYVMCRYYYAIIDLYLFVWKKNCNVSSFHTLHHHSTVLYDYTHTHSVRSTANSRQMEENIIPIWNENLFISENKTITPLFLIKLFADITSCPDIHIEYKIVHILRCRGACDGVFLYWRIQSWKKSEKMFIKRISCMIRSYDLKI